MSKIDAKLEDPGTIICNNYNGPGKEIVNMILLVTKQYIYATRSLKKELSFLNLAHKIYDLLNLERMIAIKNNQYLKCTKKWQLLTDWRLL